MPSPLNKEEREACWAARDTFFQCLDSNGAADKILQPNKDKKSENNSDGQSENALSDAIIAPCLLLRRQLYLSCPQAWAEHFEKRYRAEKLKELQMKKLQDVGATRLF